MLEDLEGTVKAVASFISVDDIARIKNAVEMSGFDFMKQTDQAKFALNRLANYRYKALGIEEGNLLHRVFVGSATIGRHIMPESTKQAIQEMWNKIVRKERSP